MTDQSKEKLFCGGCGYETDYIGTYAKPPLCPKCKNLLSFKGPGPVTADEIESSPALSLFYKILAVLFLAGSLFFMFRHFQTWDGRAVVRDEVRAGEVFYSGKTKAKIPSDWKRMAYSYDVYWARKFQSRSGIIINEEHSYGYKGSKGTQLEIEYTYSDSLGKKGSRILFLSLKGNTAYLDVPAIPYVRASIPARLKLVKDTSGNRLRIYELNRPQGKPLRISKSL